MICDRCGGTSGKIEREAHIDPLDCVRALQNQVREGARFLATQRKELETLRPVVDAARPIGLFAQSYDQLRDGPEMPDAMPISIGHWRTDHDHQEFYAQLKLTLGDFRRLTAALAKVRP